MQVQSQVDGGPIRLNLGAGCTVIDGFTPIDRRLDSEVYPLAYADNSVDEIRASHILEHFGWNEVREVLAEWVRVLKVGGTIRIAVPDFDWIAENRNVDPKSRFYLMGGQMDDDDYHKTAWTESTLREAMSGCGLSDISRWESSNTDCAALPCSLNLQGVKAAPSELKSIRIAAIMTVPRFGVNCHWGQTFNALKPFGIPMRTSDGVFWGQCLQRMFQDAVKDGLDWILTIDYDSMFTAAHLDKLIGWFGKRPDIDALCSLQVKRGQDYPLMTVRGETERRIDGNPIQVRTAHFGLTLIRVEALKVIPLPWFKGVPAPNGEWNDERIDDDIWFWKEWEKHGKTAYVAPDVRIGHIEMMVSEFDADMKVQHLHVPTWRERETKNAS